MLGCLRRLGCLVVVLAIAIAAWLLRDRWMPLVFGDSATKSASWSSVTEQGGQEAGGALESLGRKSGPVFVNLTAAQVAGLLVSDTTAALPRSVRSPEAAIVGDQIHVRASVDLEDIEGLDVLGPLGGFVDKRETIELGGTLEVTAPGTAQWRVESARIGELPIPKAGIPSLLERFGQGKRPANVAPNGIAFPVPSYIGDVRVAKGKVTVYKNVP